MMLPVSLRLRSIPLHLLRLMPQLLDDLLRKKFLSDMRCMGHHPRLKTYRERFWVDTMLNHGDADGQGATVEMAVLWASQ